MKRLNFWVVSTDRPTAPKLEKFLRGSDVVSSEKLLNKGLIAGGSAYKIIPVGCSPLQLSAIEMGLKKTVTGDCKQYSIMVY